MKSQRNRRGKMEHYIEGRHVRLDDLKEEAVHLRNKYLLNEYIPVHPRPEFHATRLKHDTDQVGLRGIRQDSGFRNPTDDRFVWWSPVVGRDELESAERRLLETTFPDRTAEQARRQQSFLGRFATSPAFEESSRVGAYRFTLSVEEVLKAYSDQFCSGAKPIMRVWRTVLYKQEVVYAVLVHSQADDEEFSDYPLLTDDPDSICSFRDRHFTWRPESMCETHGYRLITLSDEKRMVAVEEVPRLRFYVWDNVAVALCVNQQVLTFDEHRLRESLTFCEQASVTCSSWVQFDDFQQAEVEVKKLWPNYPLPLEGAKEPDEKPAGQQPYRCKD